MTATENTPTPGPLAGVGRIEMDQAEARDKFEEYVASVEGREPTAEEMSAILGFKALADGKQLLNLYDALKAGGLDDLNRPRLAIAVADWQWCHLQMHHYSDGTHRFAMSEPKLWATRFSARNRITIPRSVFPPRPAGASPRTQRAVVPTIPPGVRPRWNLANYHILWEAVWEPVPPTDPLLLRRLQGAAPLYVILAQWDLTELERSILSGRYL